MGNSRLFAHGRKCSRRHNGVALPFAAVTFFAMICFAGLALDTGHVYIVGQQLQVAADSAALAGAARVKFDQAAAITAAINAGGTNKSDQSSVAISAGDVQVGNYVRNSYTFTPNTAPYNACKVTTRATTNLLFAPVINLFLNPGSTSTDFNTANVSRQAIAMSGGTLGAGLIALDPSRPSSFGTNGNTTVSIPNGAIQVNSSSNTAVSVNGSAGAINAQELRINGSMSVSGGPSLPANVYTNTTPVPDPLASLPVPVKGTNLGAINVTKKTDNVSYGPGYYAGGINVKSGTANLSPGVYIVGPPGLTVSGGTLNASGVFFYVTTGTSGTTYGNVDLDGSVHISPPTSGTYSGVSIFVDRSTPYSKTATMIGNPQATIQGTIYMPSIPLIIRGTADLVVGNQVIVATASVSGNATFTINYDDRNRVEINNVFLVK